MGGWPTTAILTPEGELLTGATYVPPEQMRAMLDEVADARATRRNEIERALEERTQRSRRRSARGSPPHELRDAVPRERPQQPADRPASDVERVGS